MIRKPKPIKHHYSDSFIVNSDNLKTFLKDNDIAATEIDTILSLLTKCYNHKIDFVLKDCEDDWTKLESIPSPMILFIQCIDKVVVADNQLLSISKKSRHILQSFLKSLESWMIW
ncbi:MAG: hypothetical protein M3162_00095 [Thermoproteota archaeon]|nr:hypothetical protein [Thermoproteota archaeon]